MSSDSLQPRNAAIERGSAGPVLSPALRDRLEKLFAHGQQRMAKGEHDYAHDMFAQCVANDGGNLIYVEAMLENLQKKYQHNKKGGRTKGNRGPFKKAVQAENWREVIELGAELLKHNPWDVATLRSMADACASLRYNEVELRYLKNALDANPKDIEVNRHCARSLARMGQFDQAIACWHRIEDLLPNKSESNDMISKLTMAKHKWAQGILDEQLILEVAGRPSHLTPAGGSPPQRGEAAEVRASDGGDLVESDASETTVPNTPAAGASQVDPRARLEQSIVAEPSEVRHYLELAELHEAQGDLGEAESVLQRALAVSGNSLQIQEQLETVQMRRARQRVAAAQQRAQQHPAEEAKAQLVQVREELNRLELDIYERRTRRYPDDRALQYELAVRLKRSRNYQAAAEAFLAAQDLPAREALARLNRGECLQQLHQYPQALECYDSAIEHAQRQQQAGEDSAAGGAPPAEVLKLALYRAGTLAAGLRDTHRARRYLQQLAEIDPSYRDVRLRLDKMQSTGHN